MGDLRVVDLNIVDMRMSDIGVIVVGVVELEVVWLAVEVVGEDCFRDKEVVDEDYQMKMEVVAESCLLDDPTRFGAYHRLGFNHQV